MDRFEIESVRPRGTTVVRSASSCRRGAPPLTAGDLAPIAEELARERPGRPARGGAAAEPGAARARSSELRPRQEELVRSTASWRTPTAASWPSTPSWTSGPTTCSGPRAQVPLPLEHEPRVPHPAELDPRAVARSSSTARRGPDAGAGEAGRLHPQGGRGPLGAGQRPAGPGQGRGGQDRRPAEEFEVADLFGALRGMFRPAAGRATPVRARLRGARRHRRRSTPTRARSRRSCGTSSPTR